MRDDVKRRIKDLGLLALKRWAESFVLFIDYVRLGDVSLATRARTWRRQAQEVEAELASLANGRRTSGGVRPRGWLP